MAPKLKILTALKLKIPPGLMRLWVFAGALSTIAFVVAMINPIRQTIINALGPDYMAALLVLLAVGAVILLVLLVSAQDKPRPEGDVGFIDALTWSDAEYAMSMLADRMSTFGFDLIIGIDRGGAIVAGVLAKHLRVCMSTMASSPRWMISDPEGSLDDGIKKQPLQGSNSKKLNILLVDDACRSGDTMRRAVEVLRRLRGDCEIRTAVILLVLFEAGPKSRDRLGGGKQNPDYHFYSTKRNGVLLPWDLQLPAPHL